MSCATTILDYHRAPAIPDPRLDERTQERSLEAGVITTTCSPKNWPSLKEESSEHLLGFKAPFPAKIAGL